MCEVPCSMQCIFEYWKNTVSEHSTHTGCLPWCPMPAHYGLLIDFLWQRGQSCCCEPSQWSTGCRPPAASKYVVQPRLQNYTISHGSFAQQASGLFFQKGIHEIAIVLVSQMFGSLLDFCIVILHMLSYGKTIATNGATQSLRVWKSLIMGRHLVSRMLLFLAIQTKCWHIVPNISHILQVIYSKSS